MIPHNNVLTLEISVVIAPLSGISQIRKFIRFFLIMRPNMDSHGTVRQFATSFSTFTPSRIDVRDSTSSHLISPGVSVS